MPMLQILFYPDPLLRKKSAVIQKITPEIRDLAKDMAETMYHAEGIGLAAPQVGRLIRLITIDISGPEKRDSLLTVVNPVLEPIPSEGYVEGEEGCLSVEDYRAKVKRYAKVVLSGLTLDNKPLNLEAEGLLAVCLQHEVDHLEGHLFIDHLSYLKRSMYEARVRKQAKKDKEDE